MDNISLSLNFNCSLSSKVFFYLKYIFLVLVYSLVCICYAFSLQKGKVILLA